MTSAGGTDAAAANRDRLAAAIAAAGAYNAALELPAGTFPIGGQAFAFDERAAGLTVRGAGRANTLLKGTTDDVSFLVYSTLVPYVSVGEFEPGDNIIRQVTDKADYQVGDLIYFWLFQAGIERSPRQLLTVNSIDPSSPRVYLNGLIGTGLPDPPDAFKHMRGAIVLGAVAPGSREVQLSPAANVGDFNVGDVVLLTDGPGINELFGEWLTVDDKTPSNNTIQFATPVRRDYKPGLTSLIPGRPTGGAGSPRRHLGDLRFQNFSVTSGNNDRYYGFVKTAYNVAFDDVGLDVIPGDGFSNRNFNFTGCGTLAVRDSTFGRLTFNVCQDVLTDNVAARSILSEEYNVDANFTNTATSGPKGWSVGVGENFRLNMTNCTVRGYGFYQPANVPNAPVGFGTDSRLVNVDIVQPLIPNSDANMCIYCNTNGLIFENVRCDTRLRLRGQRLSLKDLNCPIVSAEVLTVNMPSQGLFLTPLAPDTAEFTDVTPLGNWRVLVSANARGPLATGTPAEHQTLWYERLTGPEYRAVFGVLDDGGLATANVEDEEPPGKIGKRLAVHTMGGTRIGWFAIYTD